MTTRAPGAGVRPFPADFELFLASASPRRRELLAAVGIPFRVVPSVAREVSGGMEPRRLAEENALRKARGALIPEGTAGGAFVLGADTIVIVDGRVLGKPAGPEEARVMLGSLSGREHEVVTGVALGRTIEEGGPQRSGIVGECRPASSLTVVRMRRPASAEVEAYIASEEWRDKAGGYAVQGLAALLVEEVRGDYSNVVGLPLALVGRLLREAGFDPVARRWSAD